MFLAACRHSPSLHMFFSPDSRFTGLLVVVTALSFLPIDFMQLAFAVSGACAYTLLQHLQEQHLVRTGKLQQRHGSPAAWKLSKKSHMPEGTLKAGTPKKSSRPLPAGDRSGQRRANASEGGVKSYQSLTGECWEADVKLLLGEIVPTPASENTVSRIADVVRKAIAPLAPEAEVSAFVCSDLGGGRAFRVAVPDVDVVISVSSEVLLRRMQARMGSSFAPGHQPGSRQLEKAAIRTIADILVSSSGFKFRRSAFRGQEPKLTLLAPAFLGEVGEAVPLDLFVNGLMPLYNAGLLSECGDIDSRAKDLLLLVRRWAKDRGICHAAKGYLSPYQWSLLVIYFLQVHRYAGEGAILPPLTEFKVYPDLLRGNLVLPEPVRLRSQSTHSEDASRVSTAMLLKDFMHFYNGFNWHHEIVSPLSQAAPHSEGRPGTGIFVQDPFRPHCNLAADCAPGSLKRMREELQRASKLCSDGAAIKELFEPWSPAED
eukprot:TRINITY_DN32295_c0_g1_i1.p1 TRINITY_DN32295_c0_g1~~TRINITY_DN32295_c0_g1_i1.p1  ORF type:complete len:486 (-),score=97.46 TRINITY_DN32295_c0_g1_i1:109-1566(-)